MICESGAKLFKARLSGRINDRPESDGQKKKNQDNKSNEDFVDWNATVMLTQLTNRRLS